MIAGLFFSDCLIVAGALTAGAGAGADWMRLATRERIRAAEGARDAALALRDCSADTMAELRNELELAEESHALALDRADRAEELARSWEHRARTLAAALEERCGPEIVEPSDTVILFPQLGRGFGGFA